MSAREHRRCSSMTMGIALASRLFWWGKKHQEAYCIIGLSPGEHQSAVRWPDASQCGCRNLAPYSSYLPSISNPIQIHPQTLQATMTPPMLQTQLRLQLLSLCNRLPPHTVCVTASSALHWARFQPCGKALLSAGAGVASLDFGGGRLKSWNCQLLS